MKPSDAYAHIAHRKTERVEIDHLEGRITVGLVTPYPPGIPLLIPGEVFNKKIVDYLKFSREFNASARASRPTSTAWWKRPVPMGVRYYADCVRA
jgi:arginine decarboxylase